MTHHGEPSASGNPCFHGESRSAATWAPGRTLPLLMGRNAGRTPDNLQELGSEERGWFAIPRGGSVVPVRAGT